MDKPNPPDILYHYTNLTAFHNIVESRMIRATHYTQLNDPAEFEQGRHLLCRMIDDFPCDDSHSIIKQCMLNIVNKPTDRNGFVFSLSEAADLLPQWRAYTDASEGGVMIGVSSQMHESFRWTTPESMKKLYRENGNDNLPEYLPDNWMQCSPSGLHQCVYASSNGAKLESVLPEYYKVLLLDRLQSEGTTNERLKFIGSLPISFVMQLVMNAVFEVILAPMCIIKHPAYQEEKEWRLVYFKPSNDPEHPIKLNERHRKFIEFHFEPCEIIKEVWISPHGNKELIRNVIEYFRDEKHLSSACEIKQSEIPFRSNY